MLEAVEASEEQKQTLSAEMVSGRGNLATAEARISELFDEVAALRAENMRLIDESDRLLELIGRMQASRSWRVTAPFRSVARTLRPR